MQLRISTDGDSAITDDNGTYEIVGEAGLKAFSIEALGYGNP